MKFLEKRKLSEALAEMFGNVRKLSEGFSEEWIRRRRGVQVRTRARGKAKIQSVSP
jgi:hypothetical protein